MEEKKVQPKKLTLSNTKQEMLEAYHAVLKQLETQKELELKPEKKLEEKNDYEAMIKERDIAEKKRRDREKEEYDYAFKREQKLAKDKFEDEKAKLEKEIQTKKEQMEGELKLREKVVAEQEAELNELRKKVTAFPKEMEAAITKTIKETVERINLEAKNREELQKREFAGEKNVFMTRIESLEKTAKEQSEQIVKLSQQLEKSYQQVQDIAVKTIEGSSNIKSFANLQQLINEQMKKSQEK